MDFNILMKLDQYKRSLALLQKKCEGMQYENERIVHRMCVTKALTKRRNKEISLLKTRLDLYNDSWRTAQPEPLLKLEKLDLRDFIVQSSAAPSTSTATTSNPKGKTKNVGTTVGNKKKTTATSLKKGGPSNFPLAQHSYPSTSGTKTQVQPNKKKRVRNEKGKDPNAPKRPANPFIQYCIEQRSLVLYDMINELQPGELEPTKQELRKQLAYRWKVMNVKDKQIYINMYESSKVKYNQELLNYNKKKLN